jgi:transcriptional regulator with XRE-family HTH domain
METETSQLGREHVSKVLFGQRIKEIRESRGLSVLAVQSALFQIGLPVSEQSWRNWERGRSLPAVTIIADLATVLDCSVDEFFERVSSD